jgi:hypothetical protein
VVIRPPHPRRAGTNAPGKGARGWWAGVRGGCGEAGKRTYVKVDAMQFKSKQKRLVAIFDAYLKRFGKTAATTEEVSEWAIKTSLYPTPKRGDPKDECEAWECRLQEAGAT